MVIKMVYTNLQLISRLNVDDILKKSLTEFKPTSINGEGIGNFFYTKPISGYYNISEGSLDSFINSLPLDQEQKESLNENIIKRLYKDREKIKLDGGWKEGVITRKANEKEFEDQKTDILCFTKYENNVYAICKLDGQDKGMDHVLLLLNLSKNEPISYCMSKIYTSNQNNGSNNSNVILLIQILRRKIEENLKYH